MGEWAPSAEAKKTIHDAYPQKKTQKRESVKQIKLETQEAKEALQFFQRNGELIIRDTQDEKGLKRAFRRLAKKMHPDTGAAASNEAFIQLKKAHAQLESCLA